MSTQMPSFKIHHQNKDLSRFFRPRSIAVIGASANPGKIGYQILHNIISGGFTGKIYPVHPSAGEILERKAYSSVSDIPEDVDLAIIAIPASKVFGVFEECAAKKVSCVAVITSGFAEIGNVEAEEKIKKLADKHNIAVLGPNMFGVVYEPADLNASFGPSVSLCGKIAFISQSGALGISLMGWTEMEGIGLASLVSIGNKADIEEKGLIEYFNTDDAVDVILIYMEGLKDGRRFMSTQIKKPVVILKVGQSQRGARAAASHTGSLAGSDRVYAAAFKQLGVLRAETFTEAFGWSRTLSLPAPDGDDTLIITNGGGIGVRTTDECEKFGIPLLDNPELLEKKFRGTMPEFGSTKNPVDITGQADEEGYRKAVGVALEEDEARSLMVLYCETTVTPPVNIARAIQEIYDASGRKKPLVVAMVGGEKTREAMHYLNEHSIPAFTSISNAVSALHVLYSWRDIRSREKETVELEPPPQDVLEILGKARAKGREVLMEHEARKILELCGVPTPKWGFASSEHEAVAIAQNMYPLAMKIASPDITHKTDVDGVLLNIRDEEELRYKFNRMMRRVKEARPKAKLLGVNLVQMVKGIECIVGLSQDPQFGPAVMFGVGGVFVELLKDVSFRVVPFGRTEAARLLDDIRGKKILEGYRGMQAHRSSLITTICAIQRLSSCVKEIDINPLITNDSGSYAVDARIVI